MIHLFLGLAIFLLLARKTILGVKKEARLVSLHEISGLENKLFITSNSLFDAGYKNYDELVKLNFEKEKKTVKKLVECAKKNKDEFKQLVQNHRFEEEKIIKEQREKIRQSVFMSIHKQLVESNQLKEEFQKRLDQAISNA